jgi:hypothetical protein
MSCFNNCFCGLPSTQFVTRVPTGGRIRTGVRFTDAIPYGTYPGNNLPRTGAFIVTNPNATILLRVASSAVKLAANGNVVGIGAVEVRVDGQLLGTLNLQFDELNEHHDLVPRVFDLTGLVGVGSHTVELRNATGTTVNQFDFSQAVVEQFPA